MTGDTLSRWLKRSRGASMLEFALVLGFLVLFIGLAVDAGLALDAANLVASLSRNGARLAASLGDLKQNDIRVADGVRAMHVEKRYLTGLEIRNTAPYGGKTAVGGSMCDNRVTVWVSARYNSLFLGLLGLPDIDLSQHLTMRHDSKTLCT